jgi:hypothetical protein
MSDPSPRARYSEEEAARILRHAALLELRPLPARAGEGFTLAELEEIAAEAGIDPRGVAAVAARLPAPRDGWARAMGGPTRFDVTLEVPGHMADEAWGDAVERVRRTLRTGGRTVLLPGRLEWRSNDELEPPVQVRIDSGRGRTRIDVRADLRGWALVCLALPGALGMLVGLLVGDITFGVGGAGLAGIGLGVSAAGVAAGRLLWWSGSASWRRRIDLLVARLAEVPAGSPPPAGGAGG